MKSVKFLEQLQVKLGKATQQELADVLGITQGAVGHYLHGRRVMDDETCLAVAMQLNIDPIQIVGAACIDRAEKSGQSSLWEVFMSRMAATAASAVLLVSVNLFLTPNDAEAATLPYDSAHLQNPHTLYYVK
ncbi:helix-turn-helix domain-containing protein [Rugamonas apoptosis]|uniref:Helix-turn-helix transcriptional regulator n=1 Tax=Rugamonas apoptosis TaxID=2758570 RepID=A0A7W2F8Z8_9BURK|nr:helix-turn-helix transcriptional regulator [Rugamonas apoptosis]MBA5687249.1 helix-turn-helix transcriptional regulator [Rugamonas apoptosis]